MGRDGDEKPSEIKAHSVGQASLQLSHAPVSTFPVLTYQCEHFCLVLDTLLGLLLCPVGSQCLQETSCALCPPFSCLMQTELPPCDMQPPWSKGPDCT